MTRPPRLPALAREIAVWTVPALVILAIYFSPRHLVSAKTAVTGLLALGLFTLAMRRPDRSLLALVIVLPFQGLILAKLFAWGLPVSVASHLSAWKETLALAVIVAGVRAFLASGRRADKLDRLALGFVAVIALYGLVQPHILPSAPSSSSIRLLGFRESGGFVLVMLGARHAPLGPRFAERAARTVFAVGVVVSVIGIYEAMFSSAWNHFVVHTMKYPAYDAEVLHTQLADPTNLRIYGVIGGTRFVRIGSVFLDELNFAFYLVLPFAIGVERILRRAASPVILAGTLAIGAALLLTETRSAILGGLIVVSLSLARTAGRPHHWRTQAVIALLALAVIAVPGAVATGVVKRFDQIDNSHDQSTAGHEAGFWSGVHTIAAHPLGQGLGTAAGIGQRFDVTNFKVPENTYLDIGDEVGVLPMLLFVALMIALVVRLRSLARVRPEPLVTAMFAAAVGLTVTAWFLQVWLDFGVAWTFWGIAGATLAIARQPAVAEAPATPPERAEAWSNATRPATPQLT